MSLKFYSLSFLFIKFLVLSLLLTPSFWHCPKKKQKTLGNSNPSGGFAEPPAQSFSKLDITK
jgi:hypothetical protein